MEHIRDKHFVFICGLHRSGTSILHRILRDNEGFSGFQNTGVPEDEGQHLQSVFPTAKAFGGPGVFGFDPQASMNEFHPTVTDESRQQLSAEWCKHWDLSQRYLLEKSPPNIIRSRYFQAMFPNSRFIVLKRHPVAVSMATRNWSETSMDELFRHWIACHRILEKDLPFLKNAMVLHYEQLVNNPDECLQQLSSFLDTPISLASDQLENKNINYFNLWHEMGNNLNTRLRRKLLMTKFEHQFKELGYSLKNLEWHAV